ncbi:MAG: hypothetical protein U0361_22310 [Nitrospiraceae bacterium]
MTDSAEFLLDQVILERHHRPLHGNLHRPVLFHLEHQVNTALQVQAERDALIGLKYSAPTAAIPDTAVDTRARKDDRGRRPSSPRLTTVRQLSSNPSANPSPIDSLRLVFFLAAQPGNIFLI